MFIRLLTVQTTTQCTLKCKNCIWDFPSYQSPRHSDVDLVIRSLTEAFKIYDEVEELRLAGAEAFLHPDIERLMIEAVKFNRSYKYLCIVTNGTYMPKQSVMRTLASLPCDKLVRVDNYGALSRKADEVAARFTELGVPVDHRQYSGDMQFYGGWIDLGDWTDKCYTLDELVEVFRSCRMPQDCHQLWDDMLINCPYCCTGYNLGRIGIENRDYVDLFDTTTTIEQKRAAVASWLDAPFYGCRFCNGYDPVNSPRIPAAEQWIK
jgi:hypothetical protein